MGNRLIYVVFFIALVTMIGFYFLNVDSGDDAGSGSIESPAQNEGGQDGMINIEQEIERTRHLQPERKQIIDGMIEGNLAARIENPAGKPFIYVLEPFYLLSTEEQSSLLNVVLYYYMTEDPGSDVLTIFSDETGQEIGTYTPSGLLMGE